MITFADLASPAAAGGERCVDRQLWLACAGGMCTVPPVGSSVYYFPQGHAEHASADLPAAARVPALVPCRVAAVRYMADPDTDEVYARIRLAPLRGDAGLDDDFAEREEGEEEDKPASFAKTLTQSDANNGGGFSVPRYCAETIFPRLDYAADPPVQTVVARDVHGAAWKFRHIYRGTPRRHLLTTGWSTFVNSKRLVAGDSIVFLRGNGGDLHVGIRRAKRGGGGFCVGGGGDEAPVAGWDPYVGQMMRGGSNVVGGPCKGRAKVRPEDVAEAVRLAGAGGEFEVTYYPRASTPEFCVRAAAVRAAARVQWSPGMRFKMAFETEDSSRISWFMGTVAGVQVADPVRWPHSPWRLLQVSWDEPDLLQNVKRVNPWLVELVSGIPGIHLSSPFPSPPRKRPRPAEFPFEGQLLNPAFPPSSLLAHGHPPPNHHHHHFVHTHPYPSFFPFPDGSAPAIQGARQTTPLFVPSLPDLHLANLQSSLLYHHPGLRRPDHVVGAPAATPPTPTPPATINTDLTIGGGTDDDVSCALFVKKPDAVKPAAAGGLMLFGQTILTEQQMSLSSSSSGSPASPAATTRTTSVEKGGANASSEGSGSGVIQNSPTNKAPSKRPHWFRDLSEPAQGQCKVFMESDTVGRDLDLSSLGSFDELYHRLSKMFCVDSAAELRGRVLYRCATGEVKHAGDESFSDFVRSARRVTILSDAGSDNLGSS